MKSVQDILDGFPGYLKRKHKGRKKTTIADVRKRQEEYLRHHLDCAYRAGYIACSDHYQGRK